ncbi:hypothetical protein [Amycolatopsis sp. NPDC004625]|uniref:hypothetical protein n=1 Tax=Amycolatopsis sp. NPDC004625 TaxID=3154670 RepID=UPI0033A35A8B
MIARINRGELAERLSCSAPTVSGQLTNSRDWKASDSRLAWALKIIEVCGGAASDVKAWKEYHYRVKDYESGGVRGELPTPPPPAGTPGKPPRPRRKVLVYLAVGTVVILIAAGVTWFAVSASGGPLVRIDVQSDPDELVSTPPLRDAMGNYATALPITQVPPPPGGQDTCTNRHHWAHDAPINGLDAGTSVAKVDITALASDVKVDRARLDQVLVAGGASKLNLLACPGRGGPVPPHLLNLDLDAGSPAFFPNGGNVAATMDLRIAKGTTESLIVVGSILKSHSRWRLELGGDDGERSFEYTVGPDGAAEGRASANPSQRPFDTIGELITEPYRFLDGAWRPGR